MTTLAKLKERGRVETFEVYVVYLDDSGKVVGATYTAPCGWCGQRTDRSIFLHNRVEVRCVQHHYGAWIVAREDWHLLQEAADAIGSEQ